MFFVILGSQKFQFNRLLREIDRLIENRIITDKVFAQIGYSDYSPQFYDYKKFLNHEEFVETIEKADLVITHGGTGAIVGAVKKGKKVIAVPRLARYGEHIDDHQIQIVEQFAELDLLCACQDCTELGTVLQEIRNISFKKYESNTKAIIESIKEYIDSI